MTLITLDNAGKISIPLDIQKKLGLTPQSQLSIEVEEGKLIIQPLPSNSQVINEEGLLVIDSPSLESLETLIDDSRSERINELLSW